MTVYLIDSLLLVTVVIFLIICPLCMQETAVSKMLAL